MSLRIEHTSDPSIAHASVAEFLRARPIDHNVGHTILRDRVEHPMPGRYWWVADGAEVLAYAWQTPTTFSAGISPMGPSVVGPLVARIASDAPDLPGVIGDAASAAAFAGAWTDAVGVAARPVEGQRIYELRHVLLDHEHHGPPGTFGDATGAEVETIIDWLRAFEVETGAGGASPDLEAVVRTLVSEGRLHLWRDGEPVALAASHRPTAGVVRVGPVYTPPERRGAGYGTAVTAWTSAAALSAGASATMLYTQLSNPTSNAIYRRIGYRVVGEVLVYRFEQVDGRSTNMGR